MIYHANFCKDFSKDYIMSRLSGDNALINFSYSGFYKILQKLSKSDAKIINFKITCLEIRLRDRARITELPLCTVVQKVKL